MPPPRQDVDVTKVFRFNGIRNFVLNLIAKKLENKQLKLTDVKKSFIQRFRGSEVRTSGCLRRAETANKLLSCEAPITACLPGFLTSGSHYSLTSAHMNFRSSHNQSVGKASIIQTYGLPCNDWNNIHSLEESANELRAKQRREGGGVAVPLYESEQDRESKGVGESKPSPQPSPIGEGAFRHSEEASNSTRQIEFCINFSRHSEALRAERIQPIMVDGGQEVRRSGWYNKRTLTNYTNIVLNENSLPSCPLNFRSSDNQPFTLHHSLKRNAAFTLAEVLITLGIIGVVAALTMPALINNHLKITTENRVKKFYSTINQAVKMSEAENGSYEFWDYPDSDNAEETKAFFNKYFAKYMNVLKITDKSRDITDSNGNLTGQENTIVVYLSDGSGFTMRASGGIDIIFCPSASKIYNYKKRSREAFMFYFNKSYTLGAKGYVEPYTFKWDGTKEDLINDTMYGCNKNSKNYAYCTKLLQLNNWKITKDYPW